MVEVKPAQTDIPPAPLLKRSNSSVERKRISMTKMDYETYGIDLATTFSGIAKVQKGLGDSSMPAIIINEKGDPTTPSCVHILENNNP